MWRFLLGTADPERRAALTVLVVMRWALIAGALFQVNYRPGSEPRGYVVLNTLILIGAVLNGILQWRLARPRAIPLWFPVAVGFYDVVGVTGAISSVEGFDNPSYLLYYPALLSFVLVFPGKWSFVYTAAVMGAYTASSIFGHDSFDGSSSGDQKALVLRLLTLATAGLMANLVVRVERSRRLEAVAAEAQAGDERLAAEQRALEAEREIEDERRRLSREIHDGVSQRVYMLSLGLENARVAAQRAGATMCRTADDAAPGSRETLLETRNLLFDLGRVMSGETSLEDLARNLATEFSPSRNRRPCSRGGSGADVGAGAGWGSIPDPAGSAGERDEAFGRDASDGEFARTEDGSLSLSIEDNGHGFEPEGARVGHGLANIRERAGRLGGRAEIEGRPGSGTRVVLRVPPGSGRA